MNKRFVKEFRTKYRKVPGYYAEASYTAARWISEGAKAVGGNVEDKDKFLAALRKVEVSDAPRGAIKLDAYGNPIQNHLCPQGREERRRALEHGDPNFSRRSRSFGSTSRRSFSSSPFMIGTIQRASTVKGYPSKISITALFQRGESCETELQLI